MQDPGGVRWDDVRIFLAVHRHGTLGQAGAKLGLDTSTVSRRLTALEAALGARLFERAREGLTATHAGERLLPAAEAMETAHGQLVRDASGIEAEPEGVVRVSAAPGITDLFVAPALVRLRAKHPKIRIELDASARVLDLTRREADLALRSVAPRGAELVMTRLLTARWVPVASDALCAEVGRVRSWDDLPWITWDTDLASFAPARWIARYAGKAEVVLRTSHFASQFSAAESGLGVLLAPEPYLKNRALTRLRAARALDESVAALPTDALWLLGHRALRDVPRVAAVWDFLVETLRQPEEGKAV
ncbi:LysR family transcriptional regulator [Chondromyces apiculatus]|uniref:Transcriptional regulator, LysR family n=1 Tax=Chondromyces apiculatus DSM 436 TaxID=1192034 RepID=A0A017THS3_9BACT|nr:LysR family transcriptional regulator [Chondromyces apiculatus]EYF08804.1 transcriptional regulator, LysR family [Chondromyces apiculatus DSM 436]